MDEASQDSKSVDDVSESVIISNGKISSPPQILDESANMSELPEPRDSDQGGEMSKIEYVEKVEEADKMVEEADEKVEEAEKIVEEAEQIVEEAEKIEEIVEKMEEDLPSENNQKMEEKNEEGKYDPFSDEEDSFNNKDDPAGKTRKSSRHKSAEVDPVESEIPKAVDETSQDSTSRKDKSVKSWKDDMTAKHPKMVDLVKYWKPVKSDPSDFQGWTYLLQYVDQENDVEAAQEVYECFLTRYPYCYGYWKKYADYMKKKAMKKDCELVFEKGLKAIPLSVDLWLHFLNYCKAHHVAREDFIREQFENAITACGLEFRSDRLWELYINWELEKDRLDRVFAIYDRLIRIPTQFHKTHWENFEDLVKQHNPRELLSATEFLSIRKTILEEKKAMADADADDAPPGDDNEPPGSDASKKLSDDETDAIKKKVKESRKEIHRKTESMISARFTYEEGIKRPYFHVKPLERGQLKNWREYLDYELSQGDEERIRILFERCLIAGAMYEEFWIKYIRYAESRDRFTVDDIRNIYDRACNIHLQKRPGIHLQWAAFEEKHGNEVRAAEILDKAISQFSNLELLLLRRINLERRRGNLNNALAMYKHAIITTGSVGTSSNLAIRASRFAAKILDNHAEAEAILTSAVEKDPANPRLYLQLVDLAMQRSPIDFDSVLACITKALAAPLDLSQKIRFAQRKLEFMEDFATSVDQVHEAEKEYGDLAKEARDKAPKREAETVSKSEPEAKKPRETHAHPAPSANYPAAQPPSYGSSSYAPQQYPSYGAGYGSGYTGAAYTGTYPQQSAWYGQGSYGYGYGSYPYGGY